MNQRETLGSDLERERERLVSRNYNITLLVGSDITSSIPSSLLHSRLFHFQPTKDVNGYLQCDPGTTRPVCAIIDHIMNKTTHHVFSKFAIPTSFHHIQSLLGRSPPTFVCFNDKLCYGFLSFYFYFFTIYWVSTIWLMLS